MKNQSTCLILCCEEEDVYSYLFCLTRRAGGAYGTDRRGAVERLDGRRDLGVVNEGISF